VGAIGAPRPFPPQLPLEPSPRHVRVRNQLPDIQQPSRACGVECDLSSLIAAALTRGHVIADSVRHGQGLVIEAP
jgi:hypothetical protein